MKKNLISKVVLALISLLVNNVIQSQELLSSKAEVFEEYITQMNELGEFSFIGSRTPDYLLIRRTKSNSE